MHGFHFRLHKGPITVVQSTDQKQHPTPLVGCNGEKNPHSKASYSSACKTLIKDTHRFKPRGKDLCSTERHTQHVQLRPRRRLPALLLHHLLLLLHHLLHGGQQRRRGRRPDGGRGSPVPPGTAPLHPGPAPAAPPAAALPEAPAGDDPCGEEGQHLLGQEAEEQRGGQALAREETPQRPDGGGGAVVAQRGERAAAGPGAHAAVPPQQGPLSLPRARRPPGARGPAGSRWSRRGLPAGRGAAGEGRLPCGVRLGPSGSGRSPRSGPPGGPAQVPGQRQAGPPPVPPLRLRPLPREGGAGKPRRTGTGAAGHREIRRSPASGLVRRGPAGALSAPRPPRRPAPREHLLPHRRCRRRHPPRELADARPPAVGLAEPVPGALGVGVPVPAPAPLHGHGVRRALTLLPGAP